ncbi:cytochrome oxidase complex assembly protein 1-domain-containing protein [Phycomyces nitens]|nr:cytochrome oxidase complex assembly protein 1-domain-containing protein [Phycomyces nitens]
MSFLSSIRAITSATRPIPTRVVGQTTRRFLSTTRTKTKVVDRELPPAPKSRKPMIIGGALVGAGVWAGVLGYAMNYQRLSSSIVNGTLFMVRYDPRIIALVGDQVDYADSTPWISGSVNHLKGKVDIGFDVTGKTGERARVHFESVRSGHNWKTIEFTVTRLSDNKVVDIGHHELSEKGGPVVAGIA